MASQPSAFNAPTCPICQQPLFGRVIWLPEVGNCHDTCVQQLVVEEIAARRIMDKPTS